MRHCIYLQYINDNCLCSPTTTSTQHCVAYSLIWRFQFDRHSRVYMNEHHDKETIFTFSREDHDMTYSIEIFLKN